MEIEHIDDKLIAYRSPDVFSTGRQYCFGRVSRYEDGKEKARIHINVYPGFVMGWS